MHKKGIMNFLIAFVASYLLFLAYLYLNQSKMMYYPDTQRPDISAIPGWPVETVKVTTADNLQLEAWYFPPKQNKPVIVLFHGNGGSIVHRLFKAQFFIDAGYGVLLAEYRGYGGNPGKPSEQGFYHDARAYMAWLEKEKSIKSPGVIFYGESIGTGPAVQMATEYKPAAVILEAPFTSTVDIGQAIYFYIPVGLLMRDRFENIEKIGKISAPLLFVHGTQDTIIPVTSGRALFDAAPEPKKFIAIDGGGHNDLYDHNAALHVLDFLSNITTSL